MYLLVIYPLAPSVSDLWRDDFLQATSKVTCRTMRWLNLEPYSQAVFAQGLKARKAEDDGEEYEGLERAMEYTGVHWGQGDI